jgi:plastocyanin domain-containing protein
MEVTGCTNQVGIPALGLWAPVIQGKTSTLEFTPEETGRLDFMCWMGMVRGSFVVE